jgi:Uncharacterized conserved protein
VYFVTLVKFRKKLTQEDFKAFDDAEKEFSKQGLKVLQDFYTLGRYDNVIVLEAPNEKVVASFFMKLSNIAQTETLVALPKAEGRKLI